MKSSKGKSWDEKTRATALMLLLNSFWRNLYKKKNIMRSIIGQNPKMSKHENKMRLFVKRNLNTRHPCDTNIISYRM